MWSCGSQELWDSTDEAQEFHQDAGIPSQVGHPEAFSFLKSGTGREPVPWASMHVSRAGAIFKRMRASRSGLTPQSSMSLPISHFSG
jgi:hypothetical protein